MVEKMKATKLVMELNSLIEEHGDQEVVCYCDHDIVNSVSFEKDSWINDHKPAFEIGS